MADYRAYLVGADGHFVSYRAFVCDNDSDATVWAKQLVDGDEVELWSGERFVTRLGVKSEPRRAISHEIIDGRMVLLIPEQAAHRFRDDAAHLFRLIAARHSD
jgi:hypothetical protein